MTPLEQLLRCLPGPPAYAYDWPRLREVVPLGAWIGRMEKTPQNPAWHGEGDVWTHTRMVCDALARSTDFQALPPRLHPVLALAALLHDIGKPQCTRLENGVWVSPRHGPVGAQIARALLWREFGLCGQADQQQFREAVCLLIRYHTLPLHLLDGKEPSLRALKIAANGALAPDFTWKALCLLAEADVQGRIARDTPEKLDAIALSQELARDEGCLDGPYPFASACTRRALFSGAKVWKDQELYDPSWGEVILLCGLPGTGKDTWIAGHAPHLPTVCLDDIRRDMGIAPGSNQGAVVQAAREKARGFLRARQPFIWNATSLTGLRSQQIALFESYQARVRIVYLETPWEENLRRNAARRAVVPESVLCRMLDQLEPPEAFEARQVEWLSV